MPLVYARHSPDEPSSEVWFDEYLPGLSVLFFDPRQERFGESVGDRYRKLDPASRRVDLVLFRGHGQVFLDELSADPLLPGLLGATPALALVGMAPSPAKVKLHEIPSFTSGKLWPDLNDLCSIELKSVLRVSAALFGEQSHYELPSGDHASSFIRVADALHDDLQVSRMADWVFEILDPGCCLVLDTGTLLSLGTVLQLRAVRNWGRELPIEIVERYPIDAAPLSRRVNDLRRRFGSNIPIVFVVSVSSSGSFIRLINQIQHQNKTIVVLFETSGAMATPAIVLCNEPVKRWKVGTDGKCEECDKRLLVRIDPRSYELQAGFRRIRRELTKEYCSRHKELWGALRRTDAVHLHFDRVIGERGTRHYGIYIDVSAALNDSWFLGEVERALGTLPKPDLVLVPEHVTSPQLIELAKGVFGEIDIRLTVVSTFSDDLENTLKTLLPTSNLLILDDALVEGRTLHQLRERLYKITQANQPRIHGFVVLARPHSSMSLRNIRNRFLIPGGSSLFHSAFSFLLPQTGIQSCPWCTERRLIEFHLERMPSTLSHCLESRLRSLSSSFRAFPSFHSDKQQANEDAQTSNSFFGALLPITAFAAASCAMQELLDSSAAETKSNPQILNVVDVPYVLNNYYDACIVGGVLRSGDSLAFNDASQRSELLDRLKAIGGLADEALLWEIVIAGMAGK